MRKRTIALSLLVLALASCFGPGQAKRYFDFQPVLIEHAGEGPSLDKFLSIDRVEVETLWNDFRIIYRRSAMELNYYPYEFWAEKPDKLLRDAIYHFFNGRHVFRGVGLDPDRDNPDWVLRSRVHRLEEFDLAKVWSARLDMDLAVVDVRSGTIIQSRSFDRSLPLNRRSVADLPVALSRILTEELEALVQSLRGKGPGPR
jgi:ABC-type uncharacterized transport system auxiliary subunit